MKIGEEERSARCSANRTGTAAAEIISPPHPVLPVPASLKILEKAIAVMLGVLIGLAAPDVLARIEMLVSAWKG